MSHKITQATGCALGVFIKTASYQTVEVISQGYPDFLILDSEHAPLGKTELDSQILAAKANQMPVLVRVPDHNSAFMGACLDMGAQGVVVPHISTAEQAVQAVQATHFRKGCRGFSTSPRAGLYGGKTAVDYINDGDAAAEVWCQIEDEAGVNNVEQIALTPGVDCLFIGRADLAVALGLSSMSDSRVDEAVSRIVSAGKIHKVKLATFVADLNEVPRLLSKGIEIFVAGSDQSLLRQGMTGLRMQFDDSLSKPNG